uniref:Uncharacterized protein n=1 Tax=Hyaloperonospora arabidopsidis (strain Emoy2) TaxID=559515 RepID=M4C4Z5_HYAAE
MLSRVSDTRVFASSEDVVFKTSSRCTRSEAHQYTNEELQGAGDDQQSMMDQACVQSCGSDWETGTMELVFLASGAIRAREGCLIGSRRLKLPQGYGIATGTRRRFKRGQLDFGQVRDYDDEHQSIFGARQNRRGRRYQMDQKRKKMLLLLLVRRRRRRRRSFFLMMTVVRLFQRVLQRVRREKRRQLELLDGYNRRDGNLDVGIFMMSCRRVLQQGTLGT